MTPGIIAAIAYGLLTVVGGVVGYLKVKSTISLFSGVASGVLLLVGAALQWYGQSWALLLTIALTGLLIVTFGIRLAKTRKFMPAGLMLLLGLPALGVMVTQLPLF